MRQLDCGKVISPEKFAHVVLRTRKLKEVVAWYAEVLGTETVFANDFLAFLTYDEEHHRIALIATGEQESAPPGAAGLDHFAYGFDNFGDLMATYKRLRDSGIRPVWTINHGATTSFYYEDPDRVRIELQVDNFASPEEINAWMESGAFSQNPIGVEFDPDKLLARYEAVDSLGELVLQGSA
jgi:catechol-2,3-dioxygenase